MLNVIMLNVIMLNVIMLNVVILNVCCYAESRHAECSNFDCHYAGRLAIMYFALSVVGLNVVASLLGTVIKNTWL
jgi:hypothetical protein